MPVAILRTTPNFVTAQLLTTYLPVRLATVLNITIKSKKMIYEHIRIKNLLTLCQSVYLNFKNYAIKKDFFLNLF